MGGSKSKNKGKTQQQSTYDSQSGNQQSSSNQYGSGNVAGSGSQSGFDQSVWGGQSPFLQDLYKQAGSLFGDTTAQQQGLVGGAVDSQNRVADQSNQAWQNQMQGGAYKDMGLQNRLMDSLDQSMAGPSAQSEINSMIMGGEGNNYADAMKSRYMADAGRAQDQMMSNMDAGAAGAGMSGSSRHGVAQALGMRDINSNLQDNMARTGFQSFDKDLDRKLQIAGQADQNTLARQGMMQGMLQNQQGAMANAGQQGQMQQGLNMGQFAPGQVPMQNLGQYAGAIGGPTVLGSGNQSGKSLSGGSNYGSGTNQSSGYNDASGTMTGTGKQKGSSKGLSL